MRHLLFMILLLPLFIFSACANHMQNNKEYENALNYCSKNFIANNMKKINENNDVIYVGLNAGAVSRHCGDFNTSNYFFDIAENSYKYDVDLENFASKGTKTIAITLLNDTIVDYDGSLYERIMVNIYKGLNFMSLDDYQNARVEFNRALMRQDKAKEYFASQIAKNRKDLQEAKKDPNYKANMQTNFKTIQNEYEKWFEEFQTTKNFTNPYATYMASLFFFLDQDYRKANSLFREVASVNAKKPEIITQAKVFKQYANAIKPDKLKKYIFLVYEDGQNAVKEEFAFTLPFIVDKKVVTASIAIPKLAKREASYGGLKLNDKKSVLLVNFDDIIATEFKIDMPSVVTKAIASTIIKTALNVTVAENDSTGGWLALASSVVTSLSTRADVRSWRTLPKSANVVMVPNDGLVKIDTLNSQNLFKQKVSKNKNILVFVRSFSPNTKPQIEIIEK
ncbi:hypothetical protein [Campylobacter sp. CCS1377]|uniref:Lipoprotein n=1 Tax=Campylobacter sp. CCS1377 TaxID=3158229 RepID=A0AAU7E9K6_9BACT